MTASLAAIDKASADALLEKVEQPEVAAALSTILDHVDLIALLLAGLDGLVGRSETIGDAILEGVDDLRAMSEAPAVQGFDLKVLVEGLSELASTVPKIAPSFMEIADAGLVDEIIIAGLTDPDAVDQFGVVAKGIAQGLNARPIEVGGVFSLARHLKDPDVSRGLGFTLGLLKAVGAQLGQPKKS